MAEDEFTDDQMIKMGYTGKKIQFYALTRRGPNTIAVYRWKIDRNDDWVNVLKKAILMPISRKATSARHSSSTEFRAAWM
jgi:hypothetical protein